MCLIAQMIMIGLRVGTIYQRDQLVPGDQYWSRSAQRMLRNLAAMKKREKQPVCDAKGGFLAKQDAMGLS